MKTLIVSLLATASLSAAACPTFNGTYVCKADGTEEKLTVKTSVANGVTQYSIDDTTVAADGQYRKVNFKGGLYDIAASCHEQTLTLKIMLDGGEGDNPDCGAEKWNLRYTMNWTPSGQNVSETHTGDIVCASGKTIPSPDMNGAMTCTLQ